MTNFRRLSRWASVWLVTELPDGSTKREQVFISSLENLFARGDVSALLKGETITMNNARKHRLEKK